MRIIRLLFVVFVVKLKCIQAADPVAALEIEFIKWIDEEHRRWDIKGDCCDGVRTIKGCTEGCNIKFSVCVKTIKEADQCLYEASSDTSQKVDEDENVREAPITDGLIEIDIDKVLDEYFIEVNASHVNLNGNFLIDTFQYSYNYTKAFNEEGMNNEDVRSLQGQRSGVFQINQDDVKLVPITVQLKNRIRCKSLYHGIYCKFCTDSDSCEGHKICDAKTGNEICDKGWTGLSCNELDENTIECENRIHNCRNGATCVAFGMNKFDFYCCCEGNFLGNNCERPTACALDTCLNGGSCDEFEVSIDWLVVNCTCLEGFHGDRCQLNCANDWYGENCEQFCLAENGCENGHWKCDDSGRLVCADGWTGISCEIQPKENECAPNDPCINGVMECIERRCCCEPGYTGEFCSVKINYCQSDPCINGGKCEPLELTLGYKCICPEPFYGDNCEFFIEENNACLSRPCLRGSTCYGTQKYYRCECLAGWTGINCDIDINECEINNPCQNNGICLNSEGSFACLCITPECTGKLCDVCKNNGECGENGVLNNNQCVCFDGWEGDKCDKRDLCFGVICPGNRQCKDGQCVCTNGFSGENCDIQNTCEVCNNGYCTGNICNCNAGFTGADCETRITGCNDCNENQDCKNNECVCKENRTGLDCSEFTLCENIECPTNEKCVEIDGNVTCICPFNLVNGVCQRLKCGDCQNGGTCTEVGDKIECKCDEGFYGDYCQFIDVCKTEPCKNGGTCILDKNVANFTCQCLAGWTGQRCETPILTCIPNKCQNGGICNIVDQKIECTCDLGYTGDFCGTLIADCLFCNTIFLGNDCEGAKCKCLPYLTGDKCTDIIPASCRNDFCNNHGTCQSQPRGTTNKIVCKCDVDWDRLDDCSTNCPICFNGGKCENNDNDGRCSCPIGYTGNDCSIQICFPNPCENGGTCIPNLNDFSCNCLPGFTGRKCDIDNKCFGIQCENGGNCVETTGECDCPPEFEGDTCEKKIGTCNLGDCGDHGECKGDICECDVGFDGPKCEEIAPQCDSFTHCSNNGQCFEQNGQRICKCDDGYQPPDCSIIKKCPDECPDECNFQTTPYECNCEIDQAGINCDQDLFPEDCFMLPCKNNGLCKQLEDGYECECIQPWEGKNCEKNLECSLQCNNGKCIKKPNGFQICECFSGYTGKDCNVALCNKPCGEHGVCKLSQNSMICECENGWKGVQCERSICENNPCQPNGNCKIGKDNAIVCICQPTFTGKECKTSICNCDVRGTCVLKNGQAICVCEVGYTDPKCSTKIDPCQSQPCKNGECMSTDNSFICSCSPNFSGELCEEIISICDRMPNFCLNGGTCITLIDNKIKCNCVPGFSGDQCQNDLCLRFCLNNQKCKIDGEGLPKCQCGERFTGERCVPLTCGNINCKDGEECVPFQDRVICQIISPCRNYCINGGECFMNGNQPVCNCPPSFIGINCQIPNQICNATICKNGGKCVGGNGGTVACNCPPGYEGQFCEVKITGCVENGCPNKGECNEQTGECLYCEFPFLPPTCMKRVEICTSIHNGCGNYGYCDMINDICICQPPLKPPLCKRECENGGKYTARNEHCRCPTQFTGEFCEQDVNECLNKPCTPNQFCFNYHGGYHCLPIQPSNMTCPVNICQNNGDCYINMNRVFCSCKSPFTGNECKDIINVQCNLNHSYLLNGKCICNAGWTGATCSQPVYDCRMFNCGDNGGKCVMMGNAKFQCICPRCYFGDRCNVRQVGGCSDDRDCLNGGSCVLYDQDKCMSKCICPKGYTGVRCENNEIICSSQKCFNGGTCLVSLTDRNVRIELCLCPREYTGFQCDLEFEICNNKGRECLNDGTCRLLPAVNGFSTYHCLCKFPFTGLLCENAMDPCLSKPCLNNGKCERIGGGNYICRCAMGWNGTNCEVNDSCDLGINCDNEGKCIPKMVNGNENELPFYCFCKAGYEGKRCQKKTNLCEIVNPCSTNGQCKNEKVNICTCDCSYGYYGDTCEKKMDRICSAQQPCLNGGTCIERDNKSYCICPSSHNGNICEIRISYCTSSTCKNDGECESLRDSFRCNCPHPYTGRYCTNYVDLCLENMCDNDGLCVQTKDKWSCKCIEYFTGKICSTKLMSCANKPCRNGGKCIDTKFSIKCQCSNGWTGEYCETNIDECEMEPCLNRGVCQSIADGKYRCICHPTFTGKHCELRQNPCILNHITCENLGLCLPDSNAIDGVRCECNHCWSGSRCQIRRTGVSCTSSYCFNDGKCYENAGCVRKCQCPIQFTGKRCENYLDTCISEPCMNGATCHSRYKSYYCQCLRGYTGTNCEQINNPCIDTPCRNGGSCIQTFTGIFCVCPERYTGSRCDRTIDLCLTRNPCVNRGKCFTRNERTFCSCPINWNGEFCESRINYCEESNPCRNNAVCINVYSNSVVTTTKQMYRCECINGFTGDNCQISESKCLSNTCGNNGKCISLTKSFVCECNKRYTGKFCQNIIDPCNSLPCANGGACMSSSDSSSFRCICPSLYTGALCVQRVDICANFAPCDQSATCQMRSGSLKCECLSDAACQLPSNLCIGQPCLNGGFCIDRVNDFECFCTNRFTGRKCETKIEICQINSCPSTNRCIEKIDGTYICVCPNGKIGPNCQTDTISCLNNGYVQQQPDGSVRCFCQTGFVGNLCEIKIDPCSNAPCLNGGRCTAQEGIKFKCICLKGFGGERCELRDSDPCLGVVCLNGGECIKIDLKNYLCKCPQFYRGDRCQFHDQCLASPSYCINGQCVTKVDGPAECLCTSNYMGRRCDVLKDICGLHKCLNEGKCVPIENSFLCMCPPTHTGKYCESLNDLCLSHQCQNGGKCVQDMGKLSYRCLCNSAFEGDFCERLIDQCERTRPCNNGGTCFQKMNGDIVCRCLIAFSGQYCDIMDTMYCKNGGKLVVTNGKIECICSSQFTGKICQSSLNPCSSEPCYNGGSCIRTFNNFNEVIFHCQCSRSFTGKLCQLRIDECDSEPCQNNGRCLNSFLGIQCVCPQSVTGKFCEEKMSLCQSISCKNGGRCVDINVGDVVDYRCECTASFMGKNCEVPYGCMSGPCMNNGRCVDTLNGFFCVCTYQFTGRVCIIRVNLCETVQCPINSQCKVVNSIAMCESSFCQTNPFFCENGGTCAEVDGRSICYCTEMFQGERCEMRRNVCATLKCMSGGTCIIVNGKEVCECHLGFTGKLCELLSPKCTRDYCFNGQCIEPISNDQSPTCRCLHGYTGGRCSQRINICISNPCRNDALCQMTNGNDYRCVCPNRYTGKNCEYLINCENAVDCNGNGQCIDTNGGNVYCDCFPGYTGMKCQQQIPGCSSNPCMNGGTCTDLSNGYYRCICPSTYNGIRCETYIPFCLSLPCQNGRCVEMRDQHTFRCDCFAGYTGKLCNQVMDPCLSQPCQNRGVCIRSMNSMYTCQCPWNYNGINCEKFCYDCQCKSNPCQNNGQCLPSNDGTFTCSCTFQYTGNRCERRLNECELNNGNCMNGGTCVMENAFTYRCNCPPNYNGNRCQNQNFPCDSSPCINGARCENGISFYRCHCMVGFRGDNCQFQINYCESNPCGINGLCQFTNNGYSCKCTPPYYGSQCEFHDDVCASRPCLNNGHCILSGMVYYCDCLPHYYGSHCERLNDYCINTPCLVFEECENDYKMPNGYRCLCRNELRQEISCDLKNPCSSRPCLNGGVCRESLDYSSYTCQCSPMYTGFNCATSSNPCLLSSPCQNGGTCFFTNNRLICTCPLSFTGIYCSIRIRGCDSNPCGNNGICIDNNSPNYHCQCQIGYSGDFCELFISPCDSSPCRNGGQCQSVLNNSYRCLCQTLFTGLNCEVKKEICGTNNPCIHGRCVDTTDNYYCVCNAGYTGKICEMDINECESQPCRNGGSCENGINRFSCNCPLYYGGIYCDVRSDACQTNPCENGGRCQLIDMYNYMCICLDGFSGKNCNNKLNYCSRYKPCVNGGTCIDEFSASGMNLNTIIDKYRCVCSGGWTGKNCNEDINECQSMPCQNGGTCTQLYKNSFTCTCSFGYTGVYCSNRIFACQSYPCMNSGVCVDLSAGIYQCNCPSSHDGINCERLRDVCTIDKCQNGGTCVPLLNSQSHYCQCVEPYYGSSCEIRRNVCDSKPCLNGGYCQSVDGISFTCTCNGGWTGIFCEMQIMPCSKLPCRNNGICQNLNINSYRCVCTPNFTGLNCERYVNDACRSMPCLNGGICQITIIGYQCTCPQAYHGFRCENQLDPCSSNPCSFNQICQSFSNSYVCELAADPCRSIPCQNSGICSYSQSTIKCQCIGRFTGEFCTELISDCSWFSCFNGGTCFMNGFNPKCICPLTYTGRNCQTGISLCSSYPCLNGGTCVDHGNSYSCQCRAGTIGLHCEAVNRECNSNPCGMNGWCNELSNNYYECQCHVGYTGKNCEIQNDPCSSLPCRNGGTCSLQRQSIYVHMLICTCPCGYTGELCEKMIDECASSPCLNGGQCLQLTVGAYTCECTNDYYGRNCEFLQQMKGRSYQQQTQHFLSKKSNEDFIKKDIYRKLLSNSTSPPTYCPIDYQRFSNKCLIIIDGTFNSIQSLNEKCNKLKFPSQVLRLDAVEEKLIQTIQIWLQDELLPTNKLNYGIFFTYVHYDKREHTYVLEPPLFQMENYIVEQFLSSPYGICETSPIPLSLADISLEKKEEFLATDSSINNVFLLEMPIINDTIESETNLTVLPSIRTVLKEEQYYSFTICGRVGIFQRIHLYELIRDYHKRFNIVAFQMFYSSLYHKTTIKYLVENNDRYMFVSRENEMEINRKLEEEFDYRTCETNIISFIISSNDSSIEGEELHKNFLNIFQKFDEVTLINYNVTYLNYQRWQFLYEFDNEIPTDWEQFKLLTLTQLADSNRDINSTIKFIEIDNFLFTLQSSHSLFQYHIDELQHIFTKYLKSACSLKRIDISPSKQSRQLVNDQMKYVVEYTSTSSLNDCLGVKSSRLLRLVETPWKYIKFSATANYLPHLTLNDNILWSTNGKNLDECLISEVDNSSDIDNKMTKPNYIERLYHQNDGSNFGRKFLQYFCQSQPITHSRSNDYYLINEIFQISINTSIPLTSNILVSLLQSLSDVWKKSTNHRIDRIKLLRIHIYFNENRTDFIRNSYLIDYSVELRSKEIVNNYLNDGPTVEQFRRFFKRCECSLFLTNTNYRLISTADVVVVDDDEEELSINSSHPLTLIYPLTNISKLFIFELADGKWLMPSIINKMDYNIIDNGLLLIAQKFEVKTNEINPWQFKNIPLTSSQEILDDYVRKLMNEIMKNSSTSHSEEYQEMIFVKIIDYRLVNENNILINFLTFNCQDKYPLIYVNESFLFDKYGKEETLDKNHYESGLIDVNQFNPSFSKFVRHFVPYQKDGRKYWKVFFLADHSQQLETVLVDDEQDKLSLSFRLYIEKSTLSRLPLTDRYWNRLIKLAWKDKNPAIVDEIFDVNLHEISSNFFNSIDRRFYSKIQYNINLSKVGGKDRHRVLPPDIEFIYQNERTRSMLLQFVKPYDLNVFGIMNIKRIYPIQNDLDTKLISEELIKDNPILHNDSIFYNEFVDRVQYQLQMEVTNITLHNFRSTDFTLPALLVDVQRLNEMTDDDLVKRILIRNLFSLDMSNNIDVSDLVIRENYNWKSYLSGEYNTNNIPSQSDKLNTKNIVVIKKKKSKKIIIGAITGSLLAVALLALILTILIKKKYIRTVKR
ncbi:hypothetical protein SNEBB_005763 [Seison nebaliae]|nr:hypothetical protein SNEBB_005763 [Seison nebaliae]